MRVLSVKQPRAHFIINGYDNPDTGARHWKDVENRGGPTKYRGRVAIHAGMARDVVRGWTGVPDLAGLGLVFGAVIGVVDLWDCKPLSLVPDSDWAIGPWCYILRDPRPIEPIPARGFLGLWTPDDDLRARILGRLSG